MNEKKDIPEYRSRGLTRKVLVFLATCPEGGCMAMTTLAAVVIILALRPLVDRLMAGL